MARNRREQPPAGLTELPGDPDSDFPPEGAVGDQVEADPADQAEAEHVARLKEKVAELEAKLALSERGVDSPAGAAADYWKVELEHARTHVVRAKDPANAWDVYCKEMGVRSSQYRPQVSPATRSDYHAAQARRHNLKPEEYTLPDGE